MPGLRFLPRTGGGWVCQAGDTYPTGMLSCYRPQRSLGQGYIFTGVCDSVNGGRYVSFRGGCFLWWWGASSGGGGCASWGGVCFLPGALLRGGPGGNPPGRLLLRAVRILLECILVNFVGNHEYSTDRF